MIKIICVGKLKEAYLQEMCNDYIKRIKKYHKIQIINIKDNSEIKIEEKFLLNAINKKDYNIYLDIKGNKYNSVEFSNQIQQIFQMNGTIAFIIGGSNGVTDEIKDLCNLKISFSDLTFPHGIFRALLLEQIYRSFKINNNEGYHK